MAPRNEPPRRGDVYIASLDPVIGHEQAGRRPFLVLSISNMNRSGLKMAIGLPVTTTQRPSQLHVRLEPIGNGLNRVSYAMPEMMRAVSIKRFSHYVGRAPIETVERAASHAGFLIGLGRTRF